MSITPLERALRNFDRVATLVRDDRRRQLWRFEFDGRAYVVHFHPRRGWVRRAWRSNPGLVEFVRLQALQKASIPSPRAVAHLSGFRIGNVLGDALIVEAIEPSQTLESRLAAGALPTRIRRDMHRQVVRIIEQLGKAGFGHRLLTLSSFLVHDEKVYLHDVQDLRRGGMRLNDVFTLAHHAARFATCTELARAWHRLNPDAPLPRSNPVSRTLWRRFQRSLTRRNDDFGLLRIGDWQGVFTKTPRFSRPWAQASALGVTHHDWQVAWPMLLARMQSNQLTKLKDDRSGQVFAGEVLLSGRNIRVIIKRPRRKFWYRYLIDVFRAGRARRMWLKAWKLTARGLPCEWPMLLMEKRVLGYATDAVIVFEQVPGVSLDRIDLDAIDPPRRQMLFRRAGRTLRLIERSGLAHYDAKSTNWIVFEDPCAGPTPVMIDVDGIRKWNIWLAGFGIRRLLRAMQQHAQYTPADSLHLCLGYAPLGRAFVQKQAATS